tara:strand:+ start:899 stop:1507 length:609 start_codon:yes stop_codon:yes gene_type:complete
MRKKLKFKKLLNQYRSLRFELEFIEDVLSEYHLIFEETYRKYCAENDIDLQALHEQNEEKVEKLFSNKPVPKEEEEEIVENKAMSSRHKSLYRDLAKKLHPDLLPEGDPRYDEYEQAFKEAAAAFDNSSWGDLFDLAERFDVNARNFGPLCDSLEEDIEKISAKIDNEKKTFSWALYECEETEDCTERVIKNFLFAVFRYSA